MRKRTFWPYALVPVLLLAVAWARLEGGEGSPAAEGDTLTPVKAVVAPTTEQSHCSSPDNLTTVSFALESLPGEREHWVDISFFDNGFLPGTYVSAGPLPATDTSYAWSGIKANEALYWRVNTLTDAGWSPSPTRLFVPCAATDLQSVSTCGGEESSVAFSWAAASEGAEQQWLDVSSFDNGFVPGTFRSVGPLPPEATAVEWDDLPGNAVVWRLNSLTPQGWRTSETRMISTCDQPEALHPRYTCVGDSVVVEFRWAPSSPPAVSQYIDLSLSLNGFVDGTYVSAGPLEATAQSFVWSGLRPNQPHFFRLNTLTADGWRSSVTRSFVPFCV